MVLILSMFLGTKLSYGLHLQFSAPSHLIGLSIGKKGVRIKAIEADRQEKKKDMYIFSLTCDQIIYCFYNLVDVTSIFQILE